MAWHGMAQHNITHTDTDTHGQGRAGQQSNQSDSDGVRCDNPMHRTNRAKRAKRAKKEKSAKRAKRAKPRRHPVMIIMRLFKPKQDTKKNKTETTSQPTIFCTKARQNIHHNQPTADSLSTSAHKAAAWVTLTGSRPLHLLG